MAKKNWNYCDGPGCMYVNMVCTACRKPITHGAFRYCEIGLYGNTMHYQHKACSTADPTWAERELQMKQDIAFARERLAAYMAFRDTWHEPALNAHIEELTNYLTSDHVREFEQRTGVGSGISLVTSSNS